MEHKKNIAFEILKKFLFILLIVCIYNTFLITKSSLDDKNSKEIFGFRAYIITTESMRPSLKTGDVIIIETVEQKKLKKGDIITLVKNGEIITHRITEITFDENSKETNFTTKGDNNNVQDIERVYFDDIIGRKVLILPFLGKIIIAFNNKIYFFLTFLIIFIIGSRIYTKHIKLKNRLRIQKLRNS